MISFLKKYVLLFIVLIIYVSVLIFIYWDFLKDLHNGALYHSALLLPSLTDLLGIVYGIIGIISIKRSLEQSKSYKKGVFYLVFSAFIFGMALQI